MTLRDALVAAAPVLIGAALVFGPIGAWLANRRTRNPAVWLALSAVTGPVALALLLMAPPGRCRACGEPTSGFSGTCVVCGAPARGGRRAGRPAEGHPLLDVSGHGSAPDDPVRVEAASVVDPPRARRAAKAVEAADAPVPIRTRRRAARSSAADDARPAADGARLASVGARRPVPSADPPPPSPVQVPQSHPALSGPVREGVSILAIGVFVQGSEALLPGARYLLARTTDQLVIIGPLEPATDHAELHLPLDGVEAMSLPGRLVVSGWAVGRSRRWALGFQSLSGLTARQVDEALTGPLVAVDKSSAATR